MCAAHGLGRLPQCSASSEKRRASMRSGSIEAAAAATTAARAAVVGQALLRSSSFAFGQHSGLLSGWHPQPTPMPYPFSLPFSRSAHLQAEHGHRFVVCALQLPAVNGVDDGAGVAQLEAAAHAVRAARPACNRGGEGRHPKGGTQMSGASGREASVA